MDSSKRRVGRPKTPPRTGPLVLENDRSREAVEVQINSETARELAEYAAWVELSSSLTTADASVQDRRIRAARGVPPRSGLAGIPSRREAA